MTRHFENENIDLHLLKACWTPTIQLQNTAPQALIDDVNIWTGTWLYNIVLSENLASWILDHRHSRLDPSISKLEAFEVRDARIESQVSSFKRQLTFKRYCKNPQRHKIIHGMSPVGRKDRLIDLNIYKRWSEHLLTVRGADISMISWKNRGLWTV